ncbi:transposase for IS629 [Escherichia coli]|nr:transposase for IS629 [Escherichia coli]
MADFTYVSTWQGFVYVAFIIDVFFRMYRGVASLIVYETTFVLDALEQALWARRPSGTVHHSDKGSQYVSLAYTERLKEAKLLASTGSTGDSYDNAMAESINGLYKAEVIHRKSWKNRAEVELATLTWVDWYNNRRLLEGWVISLRQKQKKLIMLPSETMIWQPEFTDKTLSRKTGAVQTDCGANNFSALMFFCPSTRNKNKLLNVNLCLSPQLCGIFLFFLPLPPDNHDRPPQNSPHPENGHTPGGGPPWHPPGSANPPPSR